MKAHDHFWEKNEGLSERTLPLYFNAGCCKYERVLPGIEISDSEIRLIKRTTVAGGGAERTVHEDRQLAVIRTRLQFS